MASLINRPDIVTRWKAARNKAKISKDWNPFTHHAKVGSKLQDWQNARASFQQALKEAEKQQPDKPEKGGKSSVKSKDIADDSAADLIYFTPDLEYCIRECFDKIDKLKSALQQMNDKVKRVRKERETKKQQAAAELDQFETLIGDLLNEATRKLAKWKDVWSTYNSGAYEKMPYKKAVASINAKIFG
jgi:hypothetical protein